MSNLKFKNINFSQKNMHLSLFDLRIGWNEYNEFNLSFFLKFEL